MIVVFGANGLTGREVVREAYLRGLSVRPVVRNDHDTRNLDDLVPVNDLCFADPDHIDSLPIALEGATAVVSCIDARTAGWGSPAYGREAAVNVVRAANAAGIDKILHLSVMGAYRWSPNPLNRLSFHLDRWVKRSGVPWTMLRVSCYHDEIIEAHARPPDGGSPHPVHPSSRYSPISRRDTARVILHVLPGLLPSRTLLAGGPDVFRGTTLDRIIEPYRKGNGRRTKRGPLPNGDMSVSPETTEVMIGWLPTESLSWAMDPYNHSTEESAPFWNRKAPGPNAADMQQDDEALQHMGPGLRFAVHKLLVEDLGRIGLQRKGATLDFSASELKLESHSALPHKAPMHEMASVRALGEEGQVLHAGDITFIYDELADDFKVWWDQEDGIPEEIWNTLDLGVKRRLAKHPRWKDEARVLNYAAAQHERGR
jgi:uncharacterized protein YbjT (DUF2867 family)